MKKHVKLIVFLTVTGALQAQWGPDTRLTDNSAYSATSYCNAWGVVVSGSHVHVVWYDERDGNREIYYKRSIDRGSTWEADNRLTNNSASSEFPSVAVFGTNVHVVWQDKRDGNYEIYYKRSTDGGTTWDADTRFTNDPASSENPSVAVSGSTIHVVWSDNRDGNYEIYYKRSTDGGTTWDADTRLTNNSPSSIYPSVAVSDSNVHVVWRQPVSSNWEIDYVHSTDGGITWEANTQLTNKAAGWYAPSVAVSGSNVHVVWNDGRDNSYPAFEIYYKRSTDGGTTWDADTRLTVHTTFNGINPSVAVSGSTVHVVWNDSRDGSLWEVYYKRSTDGGATWETDTRLTKNPQDSGNQSVAVSGSSVHVVWYDKRDGNYEIYYKRYQESISDVRPKSIDSPGNIIAGDPYTPKATVENPGTNPATFWTYCTISAVLFRTAYMDSVLVSNLAPGDNQPVTFSDWTAEAGSYSLTVFTALTGDEHPENDTATLQLTSTGINESSEPVPTVYSLQSNTPNPFYATTEIRYGLPVTSRVTLAIYDITGKLVKTLVNGTENLGFHKIVWNGKDNPGQRVSAGLYFIRLDTSNYTATRKIILIAR
jgi:hypothetical protein